MGGFQRPPQGKPAVWGSLQPNDAASQASQRLSLRRLRPGHHDDPLGAFLVEGLARAAGRQGAWQAMTRAEIL